MKVILPGVQLSDNVVDVPVAVQCVDKVVEVPVVQVDGSSRFRSAVRRQGLLYGGGDTGLWRF